MERPQPNTLAVRPESIPQELKDWPQWVVWRYEWREDKRNAATGELGSWNKIPYDAGGSGGKASSTSARTWRSFAEALDRYWAGDYSGIGFVLQEADPFIAVDFDGYVVEGTVAAKVAAVMAGFQTYAELSPSSTGVHMFAKGRLPGGRGRNNRAKRAEIYDRARVMTVTGHALMALPIAEAQVQIDQLVAALERKAQRTDDIPMSGAVGLLQRARNARNGAKFVALFDDGDTSGYGSDSEADLALCCLLAFWTRKDAQAMDRLFRSGRLMRPKWDEQHGERSYGAMTIEAAISATQQVIGPGADGHERPSHLSYFGDGAWRIWQVHFPFGVVEISNSSIARWQAVEMACTGGEVGRLPEYEPSHIEWRSWLREQMPVAEHLPDIVELGERGRAIAAILDALTRNNSGSPAALFGSAIWADTERGRYVVSPSRLRTNLDNPYKPWLGPALMNSVLRDELQAEFTRLWVPSGRPTRQTGDESRLRVVAIPAAVVVSMTEDE